MAMMVTVIANTVVDVRNWWFSLPAVVIAIRRANPPPVIMPKECATRAAASCSARSFAIIGVSHIPKAIIPVTVAIVPQGQFWNLLSICLAVRNLVIWMRIIFAPMYIPSAKVAYATALKPTGLLFVSQYSGTAMPDITAAATAVKRMIATSLILPMHSSINPLDGRNRNRFSFRCQLPSCRKAWVSQVQNFPGLCPHVVLSSSMSPPIPCITDSRATITVVTGSVHRNQHTHFSSHCRHFIPGLRSSMMKLTALFMPRCSPVSRSRTTLRCRMINILLSLSVGISTGLRVATRRIPWR